MSHTVMIVDDSEDIHILLKASLDGQDLTFHSELDGRRCLDAACQINPDVILLDVDMPGADGFQICTALKQNPQTAEVPIIFLTGASSTEEKLRGLEMGALDYITKPFDPAEVCARLKSVLLLVDNMAFRKKAELLEQDRADVLELIAQNRSIDDVLGKLLEMMERQFPGSVAAGTMIKNGRARHVAPNMTRTHSAALQAFLPQLIEEHFNSGNSVPPYAVCDVQADPRWSPAVACGLKTCWLLPVRSRAGEMLGSLMLFHRDTRPVDDPAKNLISIISKLISVGLEHHNVTAELAFRAHHDVLTGLPNRLLFEDRVKQALERSRRSQQIGALMLIDLDRFKLVNDTLGHEAGDQLLCQFVHRLQQQLRQVDVLARLGGDEFALLVSDLPSIDVVNVIASKLVNAFQEPFLLGSREFCVTGSIGVSLFPRDGLDLTTLQKNADAAMYHAKSTGRNNFQLFSPEMGSQNSERLELELALRRALSRNEFQLYYQPQVDNNSRLVGVEALLRWNHPQMGCVAPGKFIPLAEETGLVVPIGEWVLHEAARQNRAWQDKGIAPVRMAVNVSALQFAQPNFVEIVESALRQGGLEPLWLEIELTETLLMQNIKEVAEKLTRLRELGVGIAIDDFGTGYSSLAYLQRLPIDTLKIDRSFVSTIPTDALEKSEHTAVIRAITFMARSLGMRALAEGVETQSQRDLLLRMGCDALQGYLFGKPAPADEMEVFLRKAVWMPQTPLRKSA